LPLLGALAVNRAMCMPPDDTMGPLVAEVHQEGPDMRRFLI
jgi:hypothetical protein